MEKEKKETLPSIAEIVVVEGRNDTLRLKQFFDVDTIETGGVNFPREVIERIREAQQRRGVIVFTDPDYAGEKIRSRIERHVPGVRHAFIPRKDAIGRHKVGVEHAGKEAIEKALSSCVTFDAFERKLSWDDFIDLKIIGSRARREAVCQAFHIGPCSAKVCFRRLQQLGLAKEDIERVLEAEHE